MVKQMIANVVLRRKDSKIIQTQAVVILVNYLAFCLIINYFKISQIDWVSMQDKIFFGFLLFTGFGASVGLDCLFDFLSVMIPKFAGKNRYIKAMVLNHSGRMRVWAFLLLTAMVVISTLRICVILLDFLLRVEVLQSFFESVALPEAFIRTYGGILAVVFLISCMAIGKLIHYLNDVVFQNSARLARSEYTNLHLGSFLMMLKKEGKVTDEEINEILKQYKKEMNASFS